jgi:pimeloyl-ACP methyl ester carboxylesterase
VTGPSASATGPRPPTQRRVRTADGLTLFVADHDRAPPGKLPVVCLPGLSRCERDFEVLAAILSPERRVLSLVMRGRGRSDYDDDPQNYNVVTETGDILHALDGLGIGRAVFVGTSRGGIQIMLIAQIRPAILAGAVLNDVGPRIEKRGLQRIVATLGLSPKRFRSWDEAARMLEEAQRAQFPSLSRDEWMAYARRLYVEKDGLPAPDYDWRLTNAFSAASDQEPPELWPQFERLAGVPTLAIRGAHSDILSPETLAQMRQRMPAMRALTVDSRGHAPFLDEPEAVAAIRALLDEVDRCATTPPEAPTSTPSRPLRDD